MDKIIMVMVCVKKHAQTEEMPYAGRNNENAYAGRNERPESSVERTGREEKPGEGRPESSGERMGREERPFWEGVEAVQVCTAEEAAELLAMLHHRTKHLLPNKAAREAFTLPRPKFALFHRDATEAQQEKVISEIWRQCHAKHPSARGLVRYLEGQKPVVNTHVFECRKELYAYLQECEFAFTLKALHNAISALRKERL